MANMAYYDLRVYGRKEDVERFKKITDELDDEYIIYSFDLTDSINEVEDCGNGHVYLDFFGEVKWGSGYLSKPADWGDNIDEKTDKKIITWLDASKLFNLTIEWFCEECGSEFNEYYSVSNGENLLSTSVYWADPGIFEYDTHEENVEMFETFVEEALDADIPLDMEQVEAIRKDDYALLENTDCFSFGGYYWDNHTEDEILNRVEPVVRKDIRRD